MSAWLVTGGAGLIGSNFCRLVCNERRHKVIVLDLLTYAGNYSTIADLVALDQIEFISEDICDGALVARILHEFDISIVVNFVAESLVHGRLFLQVSTDEILGSLGPEDPALVEETPIYPNSPYAASIAAADHLVNAWHKTYDLPNLSHYVVDHHGHDRRYAIDPAQLMGDFDRALQFCDARYSSRLSAHQ